MGGVIGRDAYLNAITFYHLNPVLFHAAGKHSPDHHIIIAFNLHGPPAQDPDYFTFKLY